jgi:hypothetical protein
MGSSSRLGKWPQSFVSIVVSLPTRSSTPATNPAGIPDIRSVPRAAPAAEASEFIIDLATGQRKLFESFTPADSAGLFAAEHRISRAI